jgi:hypothetical protein
MSGSKTPMVSRELGERPPSDRTKKRTTHAIEILTKL